ncbi:MAG: VCBS repeat-containing protein [Pseudomonadota bacterium]
MAWGQELASARYTEPTDRYPHGVLGDPSEYLTLEVTLSDGTRQRVTWDRPMVFEDTAPRLVEIDGLPGPELLTVQSHERLGAQFQVYGMRGGRVAPIVSNPFIGTRFRWLGIVGAGDLDGDGAVEIAYVDRPHLAKTLRVWRIVDAGEGFEAVEIASLSGVTNHRIGETDIAGGIRECGGGPEMIVADAGWRDVLAVRFANTDLVAEPLGPHRGRGSFETALRCEALE